MKQKISLPVIIFIFTFFGFYQPRTVFAKMNRKINDFEITWKTIECIYPYLEYKQIDWDSIYNSFKPRAARANSDEMFNILVDMLKQLEDHHIYLKTETGKYIQPYQSPRGKRDKSAVSLRLVKKYFPNKLRSKCNGKIKYQILTGDIGYIYISSFELAHLSKEFAFIMEFMKNTRGIIMDIRNNPGGYCNNVYRIVSWFIKSSLEPPEHYFFGELREIPSIQPGGLYQYLQPVVVMINGASYSVAELFAELMKQVPNVTVIGDTTGGGSAFAYERTPGNFRLSDGKVIHIGTMDYRKYDGLPWEGIGVAPDIRVAQTKTDMKNREDKQLEYAIKFLNNWR